MRWNGSEPVPEINRRVAASMVKEKREGRKDIERERERERERFHLVNSSFCS
jgi:hypothetical protein